MKYLIFCIIFLSTLSIIAQEEDLKPKAESFGSTFMVNGLINNLNFGSFQSDDAKDILQLKLYMNDLNVLRLGVGAQFINNNFSTVDSVGSKQVEWDSTQTRFDFFIEPGFEHHFQGTKRLDPYIGGFLSLGWIGKERNKSTRSEIDTTGTEKREYDTTIPKGFYFGAKALIGFNYYLVKNLALGAEYRFGYSRIRTGGDQSTVIIETPVAGQKKISRTVTSNFEARSALDFSSNVLLTLTYYFK